MWEQIDCGHKKKKRKCTCRCVWKCILGFSWYSEEKKTCLICFRIFKTDPIFLSCPGKMLQHFYGGKLQECFVDYKSSLDFLLPCGLDNKRTFTFGWAYPLRHLITVFLGSCPHKSNVCMWSLVTSLVCLWDKKQIFPSQILSFEHFKIWKGNTIHYFRRYNQENKRFCVDFISWPL